MSYNREEIHALFLAAKEFISYPFGASPLEVMALCYPKGRTPSQIRQGYRLALAQAIFDSLVRLSEEGKLVEGIIDVPKIILTEYEGREAFSPVLIGAMGFGEKGYLPIWFVQPWLDTLREPWLSTEEVASMIAMGYGPDASIPAIPAILVEPEPPKPIPVCDRPVADLTEEQATARRAATAERVRRFRQRQREDRLAQAEAKHDAVTREEQDRRREFGEDFGHSQKPAHDAGSCRVDLSALPDGDGSQNRS